MTLRINPALQMLPIALHLFCEGNARIEAIL
jgi:hypothetical protein